MKARNWRNIGLIGLLMFLLAEVIHYLHWVFPTTTATMDLLAWAHISLLLGGYTVMILSLYKLLVPPFYKLAKSRIDNTADGGTE